MTSLPVMIIGGGIAGVQAALDLAEAGRRVVLVEHTPSIGGKMAALDKNFPTLDCSICIEAPKLSEVAENRNIEVLSSTEVVSVQRREDGTFRVSLHRRGNLVNDECTRCGLCSDACPVVLPNEFDSGMASRHAIFTPFPQAVPGPYFLSVEDCVNEPPIVLPCSRCLDVCPPKAISWDRPLEANVERDVAAVVATTGFDLFDPASLEEYGYGTHPDIVTAMEFERLLSSAGPTGGEILCPSDGRHAERIVFVLCAGSRDVRRLSQCSRFCCMYSIKEAVQARDHGAGSVKILYMDIRAYGKGFDGFYERARDEGVEFLRGRVGRVTPGLGGLQVRFEDTLKGTAEEITADLVVLATGAKPTAGLAALAKTLGVPIGPDGFLVGDAAPDGIFVAGSASGPKDIPDSVTEAGAAAARAMERAPDKVWPEPERGEPLDVSGDPRVGVFLCDCGSNIAGVVDVPSVVAYAKTVPGVAHAEEVRFACAGNTQAEMAKRIREKNLSRLVVGACSPKTHEGTFKRVCLRAGLNPYLLEMSNIRNQDSWVHKADRLSATSKARDMVRMAVEKAARLRPLEPYTQPMVQAALVVGGGPAGIAAATSLARQGFDTHLIEREREVGGALRRLERIEPSGADAKALLSAMTRNLEASGAHLHLGTEIAQIDGHVGNFRARLTNGESIDAGAVVLAMGAGMVHPPEDFPLRSSYDLETVTNQRLEEMIAWGSVPGRTVTFVSCIGARSGEKGCSRYCCGSMVGQALQLRRMGKKVRVLYRDLRAYARGSEELYRTAAQEGVAFFRYPDEPAEKAVRVVPGAVRFHDLFLDRDVELPTDLLVLVCGLVPEESAVAKMLKVPRSSDGFLLERHPKLGPVEAGSAGIFLAGTAQGPKDLGESVQQGLATAAKAASLLSRDTIEKEPLCAVIDETTCNGCGRCVRVCPFNALEPYTLEEGGKKSKKVRVVTAACMGCGTCAADCFRDSITTPYFTDEQVEAQIDAALADDPSSKVLVFACNWCSYAGADQAGIEKIQYPSNGRIIRTMCSGRVSDKFIKRAFDRGAGAVLVTGCHPGDCHYINANSWTEKRFEIWRKTFERRGISPDRFQLEWISAAEGKEFAAKMKEMAIVLRDHAAATPSSAEAVHAAD
ncbi:MAG TPA: hydrogenase iron-sulfur subunit [Thermoplasmata archaeon]|nr:hydrogenase iron-sulfur subunit [Thermoplasmata archaeon]